jgi:hypothetical protein
MVRETFIASGPGRSKTLLLSLCSPFTDESSLLEKAGDRRFTGRELKRCAVLVLHTEMKAFVGDLEQPGYLQVVPVGLSPKG